MYVARGMVWPVSSSVDSRKKFLRQKPLLFLDRPISQLLRAGVGDQGLEIDSEL